MWNELDPQQLAEEENAHRGACSPEQVEQIVVFARQELYNRAEPSGARALQKKLREHYHLEPLPSVRTIGRILRRNGLIERS